MLKTLQFDVIKILVNRQPSSAYKIMDRCSSVGMLTRLWTLRLGFQFPKAIRNFSVNLNVQTSFGPYQAVYLLCTGVLGGKGAGT